MVCYCYVNHPCCLCTILHCMWVFILRTDSKLPFLAFLIMIHTKNLILVFASDFSINAFIYYLSMVIIYVYILISIEISILVLNYNKLNANASEIVGALPSSA